jgi:hypothetical protein
MSIKYGPFFYGSYINFDVLKEVDLVPETWEVAKLAGFDIQIEPRANLIPSDRSVVYGIVATATHHELNRLYTEHAEGVLGETYLPEPVLVETLHGTWRAALCYISPEMEARPASPDYVDRINAPAKRFGLPDWYVARIETEIPVNRR